MDCSTPTAMMISGSARTASIRRLTTLSTAPPKYPVISPSIDPQTTPMSVASGATARIGPAPESTREKTSRPRLSSPNG